MSPERLLMALRERPFHPFRINLTDGRALDVHHPEMVIIGRRSAIVALPTPGETEPYYDRAITIDLLHVVSLEPVPTPAQPTGQS